ncbi:hypothetical protein CDD83_1630 [Cordyceps sp. RAO-2017]|nr:hypothetical protein CDD83_1630 [Cordyceps sp. RAO-2017]
MDSRKIQGRSWCRVAGNGQFDSLDRLFRQQTAGWQHISERYLEQAVQLIKDYSSLEARRIEQNDTIRTSLESTILARIVRTEASGRSRLMEMLNDERGGILQTTDHHYAETLDKIRWERVLARWKAINFQDRNGTSHKINLERIADAVHLTNEKQAVIDIHDILNAYYQVAIKRFSDYMMISVIERMVGDQSGLKFFSPEYVGSLSDAELAEMAAESESTSASRIELQKLYDRYDEALKVVEDLRRDEANVSLIMDERSCTQSRS